MVELPSAVEAIAELAREADFLSIGTNDLVMYLLAVDRTNERLGRLYLSHHPAVLRALKRIVDGVGERLPRLSACGDAAAYPAMSLFLTGLGIGTPERGSAPHPAGPQAARRRPAAAGARDRRRDAGHPPGGRPRRVRARAGRGRMSRGAADG